MSGEINHPLDDMMKKIEPKESGNRSRGKFQGSFPGLRRLMRYLIVSLLTLVLFIVLVVAVFYLFPPASLITSLVNSWLPSALGVRSAVQSITFDTLDHVRIQGLVVDDLMKVPSISLDLSLIQLLKGKLRIRKILLDQPAITLKSEAGSWNLPGRPAARPGPEASHMEGPFEPPRIPVLPIQLNLESLEVKDLSLKLSDPQKYEVEMDRIHFFASAFMGAARSSLQAEITGNGPNRTFPLSLKIIEPHPMEWRAPVRLDIRLLSENLDQYTISMSMMATGSEIHNTAGRRFPDANLGISAALGLKTQSLSVEKFEFALGKMVNLALNAKVEDIFRQPRVALHVERFSSELEEISRLAPTIPPCRGIVEISEFFVSLSPLTPGKVPDLAEASGSLIIKDAAVSMPKKGLSISGLTMEFKAENVSFQGKMLTEAKAILSARAHAVSMPLTHLKGLECSASAAVPPKGQGKGTMKLDLKASSMAVNMPGWDSFTVPISLAVQTTGNFISGQIKLDSLWAHIGDAAWIRASGSIDSWRNPRLKAEVELDADGREVLRLIPGHMKRRWSIQQLDAAARLKAFLDGTLTPELTFEDGKLSASLNADIREIKAGHGEMKKADLRLTLEEARLTADGLDAASARIYFTGHRFQFDRAEIEGIKTELKANIVPRKSDSQGSIKLRVKNANYIHPSAGTFSAPLAFDAIVSGDPFAGSIAVKDISLTLGNAARLDAHATFSSWEKKDFQAKCSLTAHAGPIIHLLPTPLRQKITVKPLEGEAHIDGWARGSLDQQWMPSAAGEVRLRANTESLHLASPPVAAEKLRVDARTKFQYSKVKGLKNIEGRHEIRWKALSLPGGAVLDQGKLQAVSRLKDLDLKDVDATVTATVAGISGGGVTLAPEEGLILNAKLKGDFKAGAVDHLTAKLNAAEMGALEASFSMKGLGKPAHADVECRIEDLSIFSALVPELKKFRLSGSMEASVKADGEFPEQGEIRFPLPLNAVATIKTNDLDIHLDGGKPLIRGGRGKIQAKIDPEVCNVQAEVGAEDIGMVKLPGSKTFPIKAEADLQLEGLGKLHINRIAAQLGRALARAEVSGIIQGLSPFLRGTASLSPREIFSKISSALEMKFGLNTEKEIEMDSMLRAKGKASIDLSLSMRGGKYITVKGVLNTSPITASKGNDLFVGPVQAHIPIRKTLLLNKEAGDEKSTEPPIRRTLLFERLRSFSKQQDNLIVDRISIPRWTLTDFRADVAIDEQNIALERFVISGLDGLIGGRLSLQPVKDGIELTFRANVAEIDLRKLLPPGALKTAEDAQLNGDINLALPLKLGLSGDALDMGTVRLMLNITHIGEKALESLLLFIDPLEKNPGIASVRTALKFAKPSQVQIHLRDGLLGMKLQLSSILATEKIINLSPLQRVPIASLGKFPIIKEIVRKINSPVRTLAILGVRSLTWSADGKPLLQ